MTTIVVVNEQSNSVTIRYGRFTVVLANEAVTVAADPCPEVPAEPYQCDPNPQWPFGIGDQPLRFSFNAGESNGATGLLIDNVSDNPPDSYGEIVGLEPDAHFLHVSYNQSSILTLSFKPSFSSNYQNAMARVIGPNGEDITDGWVDLEYNNGSYFASVASQALRLGERYCVEFSGVAGVE